MTIKEVAKIHRASHNRCCSQVLVESANLCTQKFDILAVVGVSGIHRKDEKERYARMTVTLLESRRNRFSIRLIISSVLLVTLRS